MRRTGRIVGLLTLLPVLWCGLPGGGCTTPHSGVYEPFWRNRFKTLTRSVEAAKKAQADALVELEAAQPKMRGLVESRETEGPYKESRHVIARCDSRVTQSANRVKNVKDNCDQIFEEWRRESRDFADAKLREQSRRELEDIRARADRLIKALEEGQKAMGPVLVSLKDDSLYLRHRRGVRDSPPPAYSTPGAADAAMAKLRLLITEAGAECESFIASFPLATEGTP